MRTYLVESWVGRPCIIEANTKSEAENEYLRNIGYSDFCELAGDVGWNMAVIEVEELVSETYH